MTKDESYVEQALEQADLRVLLMVLFHLTGDEKWLTSPYLPTRDVRLIASEDAGFDDVIQNEIRAAGVALVGGTNWRSGC